MAERKATRRIQAAGGPPEGKSEADAAEMASPSVRGRERQTSGNRARAVASVEHNIAHYWEMMQMFAGRPAPGHGASVGVAIRTGGVVVVGNSDLGSTPSPARLAGLKSGDVIESVDGEADGITVI